MSVMKQKIKAPRRTGGRTDRGGRRDAPPAAGDHRAQLRPTSYSPYLSTPAAGQVASSCCARPHVDGAAQWREAVTQAATPGGPRLQAAPWQAAATPGVAMAGCGNPRRRHGAAAARGRIQAELHGTVTATCGAPWRRAKATTGRAPWRGGVHGQSPMAARDGDHGQSPMAVCDGDHAAGPWLLAASSRSDAQPREDPIAFFKFVQGPDCFLKNLEGPDCFL